jgi:hypothetical protein
MTTNAVFLEISKFVIKEITRFNAGNLFFLCNMEIMIREVLAIIQHGANIPVSKMFILE